MKKFVIITDSCSDLEKELREAYDIDYVPMHFSFNGRDVVASLDWEEIPAPDFYNIMRGGTRIITSQVNAETFRDKFTKYLEEGYDVLYIGCSSALSNSVKASYLVRDELLAKYPDSKIICIDSLISCYGLGILCMIASELRKEGKSIDEVSDYIMAHRLEVNQEATVESLKYLKQAGRVSATSAFFGGILSIKPIIISDAIGQNFAIEKVKGRKVSFSRLVERMKEEFKPHERQKVYIGHADCLEDANELKRMVLEAFPNEKLDIHVGYIGPIVGASVGPGTLGLYFLGKEVTVNGEKVNA